MSLTETNKEILLLRSNLSPGDIVTLTAAIRDLHIAYPGQYITGADTTCYAIWEHNPYITRLSEEQLDQAKVITCEYPLINTSNQRPYHFLHGYANYVAEQLGKPIPLTAFKGDIHLTTQEKNWLSQVNELGEHRPFWIINAGGKFDFTIKWWMHERYQEVVDHFKDKINFVQVGELTHNHKPLNNVINLVGKTRLRQLIRLVYHAQGIVCPVTGLMHMSAAIECKNGAPLRPCVVIAGGREPAHWEEYPGHQFIHTIGALPCCAQGGCWKARTVPIGDGDEKDKNLCVNLTDHSLPKCMNMITSEEVIRRIELYFSGGVINYL